MAHRKEEYTANGHDVTIQQVNEGGDISAWLDGRAVYENRAIDIFTENPNDTNEDIVDKTRFHLENDEPWDGLKTLLSWMCECHVYFCPKCETFYDYNNSVGTGFAGHKCGKCDQSDKHCPDNPDGDSHEDRCLNPRQKNNARVSTKYQCKHCGRKRKTTPTG